MSNQFTIFRNTDVGAPTLNGQTGSLVTVLSTVLVSAGWSIAYTGTSTAVYRQGGGNQFYLRVQDDGPGVAVGQEARITGYESMTGVNSGSAAFPTATLGVGSNPVYIVRKSSAASATARDWICVADNKTFYFFADTGDTAGIYYAWGFGDFYSVGSNDNYRTFIVGRTTENSAARSIEYLAQLNALTATSTGFCVARNHLGLAPGMLYGRHGDAVKGPSTPALFGQVPHPNPTDGNIYLSPIWLHDGSTTFTPNPVIRGRMRGLWQWLHPIANVNNGDTFSNVGDWAGKDFLVIKGLSDPSSQTCVAVIETSATLEEN